MKLTTPCGRTVSISGHPYTKQSLQQHIMDCSHSACRAARKRQLDADITESVDPLGVLDDDMPDGAYWAMHNEIYGWP